MVFKIALPEMLKSHFTGFLLRLFAFICGLLPVSEGQNLSLRLRA